MDETFLAFKYAVKNLEKNIFFTNGHQTKYTYYFTLCHHNNAAGFYFMISP